MKNIIEIYKEYKIMPNLVQHQIRVAAVAMQICNSLNITIDKDSIVKACLIHDMGNIIKFDLSLFPEWSSPEGEDYWESVKSEYIAKYGDREHNASNSIASELGVSFKISELIKCVDSSLIKQITNEDDFEKKICIYSDNRVSPHGIVSAEEHSLEAKERYKNHKHAFNEESRLLFNKDLNLIEKQIFSISNIKPEDINDESVKDYLEKLKNTLI